MNQACPFCDPAITESEFASSPNFRAIYNLAPILPGHSLIIPREHVQSLLGLSEEKLHELMSFSCHVMKGLLSAFGVSAFNWTIQEGEEAGQTIPHLHVHLIPRRVNDLRQPEDWYRLLRRSESEAIDSEARRKLDRHEIRRIVADIRRQIAPFPEGNPTKPPALHGN